MGERSVEVLKDACEASGARRRAGRPQGNDRRHRVVRGCHKGGLYHGSDAVVQNVFGPMTTDILNYTVAPEESIASGDTVAVVVRYTGTGKATGKELDLTVVHVWDVRDGKIARFRQFANTARFLEVVPMEVATTA